MIFKKSINFIYFSDWKTIWQFPNKVLAKTTPTYLLCVILRKFIHNIALFYYINNHFDDQQLLIVRLNNISLNEASANSFNNICSYIMNKNIILNNTKFKINFSLTSLNELINEFDEMCEMSIIDAKYHYKNYLNNEEIISTNLEELTINDIEQKIQARH